MPETEKFTALGMGNGLPYCMERVDVSDFTHVAPMTLTQATHVYYNIYSMEGTASLTNDDVTLSVSDPVIADEDEKNPVDRVCGISIGADEFDEGGPGNYYAVYIRFVTSNIVALYDGDITDDSNLFGYGFSREFASSIAGIDNGEVGARVSLLSYAELDGDPFWWQNYTVMGEPDTVTTETIGGVPFLKAEWTSFNEPGDVATITDFDYFTYPA